MSWADVPAYWKRRIQRLKKWRALAIEQEREPEKIEREAAENEGRQEVITTLQAVDRTLKAKPNASRPKHLDPKWWQDRRFLLDVAGIAIAAGVGWIFFRQQNIMQGQLDEMQAETQALVAPINLELVKPLSSTQDAVVTLLYQNIGKMPAGDYSMLLDSGIVNQPPSEYILQGFSGEVECILADERRLLMKDRDILFPLRDPSQATYELNTIFGTPDILGGKKTFYIFGCFRYTTGGGARWSSVFCFYWAPVPDADNRKFAPCPSSNYIRRIDAYKVQKQR